MKKHYMVAKPAFIATLLVLMLFSRPGKAQCPTPFENFTYTSAVSWNTSAFTSHQYKRASDPASAYMRFRMMTPNGFNLCANDGQKYPLIVFLHGSGESGAYDAVVNNGAGEQNNDLQLVHGGQRHRDAVLNNTFPGFVIFPQIRRDQNNQNYWGPGNLDAVKYIIDKLIADYKVDPDRIYMHGLSMGGEGTWIFLSRYPKYIAAAHPMSAAGSSFWGAADLEKYKYIPLRHAQGGLDTAPSPDQGNEQVQKVRGVGGSIRYSYYANLGHGTWNDEYNKSDFFSWFLSKRKNQIAVLGERTTFCPGENFSVTLGVTPGFTNYQWTKDNTSNPVYAVTSEITITQAIGGEGTYYVRYQRDNGTMTDWSAGVVISRTQSPSATPAIATNGQSLNLPALDGSPEVILYGSAGKAAYEWSKDAAIMTGVTSSNITVNLGGSYTLKSKDPAGTGFLANNITPTEFRANPQGCLSAASTPVVITTQNGLNVPAPPTNFFASANTPTSVTINWDDRSSNETGFELYRSLNASSGYELITIRPATATANPQAYVDNGLQANTTYFYRMRAVNNAGGSAYTPVAQVTTAGDNIPPTAPVLVVGATSRTEINLSWSGATDNVGVFQYDIYQNGVLVNTTATTTYKATNLVAFSTYTYVVKARDVIGNVSPPSNQVSPAAVNTGLFYTYYHHPANLTSTDQLATAGTLIKTGYIAQFRLDPRTQNDGFGFMYEGFINIPTTGNYTFFTSSDDGSKLFVNNVLVVNNDGTHGCTEKASSTINLSAGTYPIKALMFEDGGGECLTVTWQGPGISKAEIPASALRDNFTPPTALTAPNLFNANAASFSQINLSWNDRSNNETGFEISRSTSTNGTYQVIVVTAANATSFQNTGLNANTTYYYKIRAISANNASSLVGPTSAQTSNAPSSPSAPSSLAATAPSATQINLTWNDNSSAETGYEIHRSSSSTTGFVAFATVAANVTSFSDTQVSGHSTLYYKVRAIRTGASPSGFSNTASATTPNRAPVIADVPNQTIFTGTQATIQIAVTDADNDAINFNFTGLPAQATFQSNGYGIGTLTFPSTVPAGAYNITAQATDGITPVSDSFVVTVGNNHSPDVSVTVPTPFTGSLTTEEGRTAQIVIRVSEALDGNTVADPRPSLTNLPVFIDQPLGWSWNNSTKVGLLTFNITPEVGEAGVREIPVTFSDGVGGITTYTFTVTVLPIDPFFTISLNLVNNVADPAKNYNPSNYFEQSPWNNISQNQALSNMVDDQGNMVRFVTALPTQFTDGTPRFFDLPATQGAVYTEKIRESFLRKTSGTNAQLAFSSLNTKMVYKVTVFGSGPLSPAPASSTKYELFNGVSSTPKVVISNGNNATVTRTTAFISAPNGTLAVKVLLDDGATAGQMYLNSVILTGFYDNGSAPDAPVNLTLNAPVHNRVNITWKDNSFNEDRFEVLRSATANGPWTVLVSRPENDTSYVDNTVVGRTSYYYKIRAFNEALYTDSEVKLITTPNGIPVLAPLPTIVLQSGQIYQHNISATDPENDPLVLTALNLPLFATLVDNGDGTGFIRFIPQSSDIGSYNFIVQATDNFSARSETGGSLVIQDAQYQEVVYINFTGAGTTSNASAPWNNVGNLASNTDLLNSTGGSSPIDLNVGTGWTASANTGGVNTGNNSGLFPDKILQSYWETTQTDVANTGAVITLSGLDVSSRYNLELLGSRNQFWFGKTLYVVTGATATTKTLNVSKNATNSIKFSGVTPNASGIITIQVKRAAAENASPAVNHLNGTLNAMIIETAIPGVNPIKPSNLKAEGISKSAIKLSWTDNASDETGFEIYRATSQGGPYTLIQTTAANIETFTNTSLSQNMPYIYRIRAIKSGGASVYTNDVYASTYDQIILINVNSSAGAGHTQAAAPWNNLATPPVAGLNFSALKNDLNVATTVGLQMLNWANGGTNNTGFKTGNNSGIYPDAVLEAYYYYEQSDPVINHKLTGLNANRAYDLVFMGSEWSTIATIAGSIVATDYSVGTETVSQFNGKNTMETVAIRNIKPDQTNAIDFQVKQNDEARYGVWNAMEIRSYTPISTVFDQTPPSVPQGLAATDTTDVSVDLQWSASTDNTGVAGYEVFQGSTLVATVTTTTAQVTGLQPSTVYTFTVRAFDVKGNRSPFATPIQITTLPSSATVVFYYSKPSGDLSLLSTWGRQTNGGGTAPGNFISNNQHFIVNRDATIGSNFGVSGSNSKLIVDVNRTVTVNATLSAIVDLSQNTTMQINTATAPTFGTLHPTSTVVFNTTSTAIPGAIYGNVALEGSSSTKTLGAGTYFVNGNLTVGNGVTLNGAAGNSTTISLSGNLVFEGTAVMNTTDQLIDVTLTSKGTQSIIAPQADITLFQLHIGDTTTVNISSATARTITLGSGAKGGLVLDSGAVFNLGKHHLKIEGTGAINEVNNGSGLISTSKGSITINSSNQVSNLYFATGADTIKNFSLNSSPGQVHVRTKLNIQQKLDITNGAINSNGNIVLLSDASGTAWIGPIRNTGALNGNIEFQRYVSATGRVYRYMSAPVIGSTVANWSSNLPVTGPFTGSTNKNTTNSLYYYDNDNGWVGYPSETSQEQLEIGRGYSIFNFNGASARKLRINGPIAQGVFAFNNLGDDATPESSEDDVAPENGWNLLGNPYAAPIQWGNSGWQSTGLNGSVYVRHNEVIDGVTVSSVRVHNGTIGTLPDGVIAQGQAFWVKAIGEGSPALTITEDAKYDAAAVILQRTAAPNNLLEITITKGKLSDQAIIHFRASATDDIDDSFDALKLANNFFNLSTRAGINNLAINTLPESFCQKTVALTLTNTTPGQYTFSFGKRESFNDATIITMIDHFTGEETVVEENTTIAFDVTSDPASASSNRFELNFSKPALDEAVAFTNSTETLCGDNGLMITLNNTQQGVAYTLSIDETVVAEGTGNGATVTFNIQPDVVPAGHTAVTLSAAFNGCTPAAINAPLTLSRELKPVINVSGVELQSSGTGEFQWYEDGNAIPGAIANTYVPEHSGSYQVKVSNGICELTSDEVVFAVTGIEEGGRLFELYPNPVKNQLTIRLSSAVRSTENVEIQIVSMHGVIVSKYYMRNSSEGLFVNTGTLADGLYTILINAGNQQFEDRFIKE